MKRSRKRQSGQATTEYALITLVLCMMLVAPIDGSDGFMFKAINAYKTYYTGYYYVLNLPFP